MPSLLDRFRRLTPPGSALPGGAVPLDPRVAARAELAPVFAAAVDIERDADEVRIRARQRAEAILSAAHADVAAIMAAAAQQTTRVRTAAAARVRAELKSERSALEEATRQRTRAIAAQAASEHPQRIAAVVAAVRGLAAEEPL